MLLNATMFNKRLKWLIKIIWQVEERKVEKAIWKQALINLCTIRPWMCIKCLHFMSNILFSDILIKIRSTGGRLQRRRSICPDPTALKFTNKLSIISQKPLPSWGHFGIHYIQGTSVRVCEKSELQKEKLNDVSVGLELAEGCGGLAKRARLCWERRAACCWPWRLCSRG